MALRCIRAVGERVMLYVPGPDGEDYEVIIGVVRVTVLSNQNALVQLDINADKKIQILREELVNAANKPGTNARILTKGKRYRTRSRLSDGGTD